MKIEDVFGDYQNGNLSPNQNVNQNKKTKLEDTLGYTSVNNGGNNYNNYNKGGNKKSGGLVIGIVFSIIAVLIILIVLYITTDFLKGPKQLLAKYTLDLYTSLSTLTPLSAEIAETKPTATEVTGDVSIRVEESAYQEAQNIEAKVVAKTITDAGDSEIILTTNALGEEIDVSFIKSDTLYAIGSSKLVLPDSYIGKNYVAFRNEDLKTFANKLMPGSEMTEYIPNQIDFSGLENLFTEEEIDEIKTRYLEIVTSKITEDALTVEKNVPVSVDGQEISAKRISIKINYAVLQDILVESLEALKTDTLILDSYKRVIDIEIDKTKITNALDEMKNKIKTGNKEYNDAYFMFAMYAAKNKTVAVEFGFMKNEEATVGNIKMEIFDGGIAFESYMDQTETEPSSTTRSVIRVVSSDISETIDVVTNVTYDIDGFKNLNSWEEYYREEYKDTKTTCSYEITSYKKDVGYNDELKYVYDDVTLKYKGKVSYNQALELTTLSEDNCVVINDLNLLEILGLVGSFKTAIFGEEEEIYPSYDDTEYPPEEDVFGDSDLIYDEPVVEEPVYEEPVYEEQVVEDDNSEKDAVIEALRTELNDAIRTCESEAEKYEEYFLKDFVNDENLKMLCPSISSVTLISSSDSEMKFEIITTDGNTHELLLGIDGDDSGWSSISSNQ